MNEVADVNERANIAGAGINIAQRVMDCGDAGHILLSRHVAEDLKHLPEWRPYLHDVIPKPTKIRRRVAINAQIVLRRNVHLPPALVDWLDPISS